MMAGENFMPKQFMLLIYESKVDKKLLLSCTYFTQTVYFFVHTSDQDSLRHQETIVYKLLPVHFGILCQKIKTNIQADATEINDIFFIIFLHSYANCLADNCSFALL